MAELEDIFTKYRKEMVDFVESKVRRQIKVRGDIYDTIANLMAKELPYGKGVDDAHAFLTNAIISALWCGWFSQARANADDAKFRAMYVKRYKDAIKTAFEIGKKYAQDRP
jgi:hypothetical protein